MFPTSLSFEHLAPIGSIVLVGRNFKSWPTQRKQVTWDMVLKTALVPSFLWFAFVLYEQLSSLPHASSIPVLMVPSTHGARNACTKKPFKLGSLYS